MGYGITIKRNRRFIPAYAGNAQAALGCPIQLSPVHPRVRGERFLVGGAPIPRRARFIPAYAGNQRALPTNPVTDWDAVHPPRTRGTPKTLAYEQPPRQTVHPRVRGKNLINSLMVSSYPSVHPRVRGEHPNVLVRTSAIGSSPRTRGTPLLISWGLLCHPLIPAFAGERLITVWGNSFFKRFIPAYAGNARRENQRKLTRAVHPRVRGERIFNLGFWWLCNGSSPRTRGTQ